MMSTLARKELKALQELADTLRRDFGAIDVRIFGSAARGEATPESDIDLFVVLPEVDWETEKKIYDLGFWASLELDKLVSVVVYSSSELAQPISRVSPFLNAVRKEGRPI